MADNVKSAEEESPFKGIVKEFDKEPYVTTLSESKDKDKDKKLVVSSGNGGILRKQIKRLKNDDNS